MKRIVVLGAGMVGSTIARDLAAEDDFTVISADRDRETLADISDLVHSTWVVDVGDAQALFKVIENADAVVNAVPGFLGFQTLKTVIEAQCPVVDISFMPEDPFELNALAHEKNVPAVVDFGVAPGLSNLLVGHSVALLDEAERVDIVVGGLPQIRRKPWEYAMPFSPVDVLEEYTRPVRFMENGEIVTRPALSEPELIDLPHIGTLEAFNTDGLRTLLRTIDCPFMRERTMRYPGYAEKIKLLVDSGFFSTDPISIDGQEVRPFDVTATLLFDAWKLQKNEPELTVMRVVVIGTQDDKHTGYLYDLYDEYDELSETTSMARTTGFPAAIMARMLARKEFTHGGIFAPEMIGANTPVFEQIMAGLEERDITVKTMVSSS
jgi:lysine 6-dehydrogenase